MKKVRPIFYLNWYGRLKESNRSIDKISEALDGYKKLSKSTPKGKKKKLLENIDTLDDVARKDAEAFGKSSIIWAILSTSLLTSTIWLTSPHGQNAIKQNYYVAVAGIFPIIFIGLYLGNRNGISSNSNFHHLAFAVNLFGIIAIIQGEFFSLLELSSGKSTNFLLNITIIYLILISVLLVFIVYDESGKSSQ